MQQEFISSFNQFGKNMVNSAREFAEINGRFAGKILENQIGLAKVLVESSEQQVDASESIKSPAEYVSKQAALVGELSERISDATKNSVKIAEETNLELKSWFEKGVKAADNAVKETKDTVVAATVTATTQSPAAKSPAAKPVAKKAATKKPAVKKTSSKATVKVATAKVADKAPVKAKVANKSTTSKPAAAKAPVKAKAPAKKASPAPKKPAVAVKKASSVKTVAAKQSAAPKKAETKTTQVKKAAADK